MQITRIGFIGLGTMGLGMAGRLLAAGFPVTVYNRHAEKAQALASRGARIAYTPAATATDSDVIISMVADDCASRAVWVNKDGVLQCIHANTILVESSTLTPHWVRELAQAAAAAGCDLVDAPVTGSKVQAENGQLLFLAGGNEETVQRLEPVLRPMARAIKHVGPNGAGAMVKLLNNFLCAVQAASLAEAMALLNRSGIDASQALDVILHGAPGSPILQTLVERASSGDDQIHFRLELMAKDLRYALQEARAQGMELRSATTSLQLFERALERGFAGRDFSAIIPSLRN